MNTPNWDLFTQAVHEVFRRSTMLQIIREHRSPKVASILDDLELDIIYWFRKEGEVFPDEIAFHVADVLQSIHTEIEYDEAIEMGKLLHEFYADIRGNRLERLLAFVATIPQHAVQAQIEGSDTSSDEEDTAMELEEFSEKPLRFDKNQPDDDGWFTA